MTPDALLPILRQYVYQATEITLEPSAFGTQVHIAYTHTGVAMRYDFLVSHTELAAMDDGAARRLARYLSDEVHYTCLAHQHIRSTPQGA